MAQVSALEAQQASAASAQAMQSKQATVALGTPAQVAQGAPSQLELPELQNTPQGDRVLLREVGDRYIYDAAGSPTQPRTVLTSSYASGKTGQNLSGSAWEFVRRSTRMQLPDHKKIAYYRKQYRQEAPWISLILHRADPFIGYVVEKLDQQYLPVELALLPAIESGYRPDVQSPQQAVGIWQIVPATAKDIGMSRTPWFDGRSDIREATIAAIDYLSYLNAEFHGDWLLTLAAYNGGLGRVRSAIARNQKAGLATDFWSLKLPRETREYVPKFLALVAMLRHDQPEGLIIPSTPRGSAFDIVDVRQRASIENISTLTGVSVRTLTRLNAGLLHGVTPPQGPHYIYLPQGKGAKLINRLLTTRKPDLYTPAETHVVVAGDTLSALGKRYRISQERLRQINALDSDVIRIGQKLTVLDMDNTRPQVEYIVTIGDTVSEIARRYSVSISDVRDAQGRPLQSDVIHPGDRLSLLTSTTDQTPRVQ